MIVSRCSCPGDASCAALQALRRVDALSVEVIDLEVRLQEVLVKKKKKSDVSGALCGFRSCREKLRAVS